MNQLAPIAPVDPEQKRILAVMRRAQEQLDADPTNPLTEQGFEVLGTIFDEKECDRLVALARSLQAERSYLINDNAYFVRRAEMTSTRYKRYDFKTSQIFNVQDIDAAVGVFVRSGQIESWFRKRTRLPVRTCTCSIMLNEPDEETRQPLHVDGYERAFKLFVYLSDVEDPRYGPLSVVPGSHRHIERRLTSFCDNQQAARQYAQMECQYSQGEAQPILGRKGTCILADTSAVHAGWPAHTERTRYMMAVYLTTNPRWQGPFDAGKDYARPPSNQ